MYEVEWSRPSERDLRRLDQETAQRVYAAIRRFADSGYGDVARIRGAGDEFRLRVGDIRVRFSFDQNRDAIVIKRVLPRDKAYGD